MKQVVIAFGILITALLILFRIAAFYHVYDNGLDNFWIAGFSILFLVIGIVLSRKLYTRTVIVTQEKPAAPDQRSLLRSGLSKREAEILILIHDGLSNQQIADKLFLSENTIKKHVSNIFTKLQVDRRTEAVKKALELSFIQ